jgi:hypothetical protein
MNFEQAHAAWLEDHLKRRKGERRSRLERGHAHAEKLFARNIWWEVKGNFDHLHPEYEVADWRGRPYFADFCYRLGRLKLLIEIKGYSTHVRDMDRTSFSRECNRETFLTGIGYTLISFSYDDVNAQPDLCITLLKLVLSNFEPQTKPSERTIFAENEVLRLALHLARPIRPIDVAKHFGINHRTAVKLLQTLTAKGKMRPSRISQGGKVMSYELVWSGQNGFCLLN